MSMIISLILLCGVGGGIAYMLRPTITEQKKVKRGENFAKLIYTDEQGGKLLHAKVYGLQGKPDYIFQKWFTKKLIPFEVKSGKCKESIPHEGDLMQLVAYFLIIEEVYDVRPPFGRLVYNNKTFTVRNTAKLRRDLKNILKEMQNMLEYHGRCHKEADPSYIKCKNCVCQKTVCEWYDREGN